MLTNNLKNLVVLIEIVVIVDGDQALYMLPTLIWSYGLTNNALDIPESCKSTPVFQYLEKFRYYHRKN
jgi:hypothetical protein